MKKAVQTKDYMGMPMKANDWISLGILFGLFIILICCMIYTH